MRSIFLTLGVALFLACTSPLHLTVKTNEVPLKEVKEYVPMLAEEEASLYVKVQERDLNTTLLELLTTCAKDDVSVTLWPLLEDSEGPWACEENIQDFTKHVEKTLEYTQEHEVAAIAVNVEASLARMGTIRYLLKAHSYTRLIDTLLENLDPEAYQESLEAFKALCELIQSSGKDAIACTYPMILDDYRDKDADIQDVCGTPIFGIPWDKVIFNTYRTSYSKDFGVAFSPYFVYSYAVIAKALGHTVAVGVSDDYTIGDYALDIRACRAAGLEEVYVHRLKSVNRSWLKLREADAYAPQTDHKVIAFRAFTYALDKALDNPDPEVLKDVLLEFSIEMRNFYE